MDISRVQDAMRVYGVNKVDKVKKVEKAEGAAKATGETFEVSGSAKDFSKILGEAMKAPEVREDKVELAKENLENGNITPEEIANSILRNKLNIKF
ncbi:MAG: flagellar biosynthesis anti-sigma factor FlgM [Clostridia bacterium]|jgi:anti-sigma28 factor (negative regulator of flagellin synthesis)|nr:flagellar biosynthesis anti-sigma factor FlgM [Clostridia bacterium]